MEEADNVEVAEAAEAPASERPEWLPEKFNTPEDLVNSYSNLESKLGKGEAELRAQIEQEYEQQALEGVPASVGDYELPDIIDVEEASDNPMLQWWAQHSFDNGYTQDEFADGIAMFAEYMGGQEPDLDAEREALGENATARIEAVDLWSQRFFPQEYGDVIEALGSSAAGIEFLEHIMSMSQSASPSGRFEPGQALNQDHLNEMMKDPRYWDVSKRDPNYVKKVQEGFSKLYG